MNTLFNVLSNVSPLIYFFHIYILYKAIMEDKKYWNILENFFWLIEIFILALIIFGYGHFIISVINLFLWILFFITAIIILGIFDKSLFWIVYPSIGILFYLYVIYNRLEREGIIKFDFISKIKETDIFSSLAIVFQNDWFKGIVIASVGGIISGLVVNKISKRK